MASTSKLAFIIVLMCVIVPVGAGYLLPSGASDHTVSESTDSMDLTARLNNSTRPIYTEYTGVDNNRFVFTQAEWGLLAEPNVTTTSANYRPFYGFSKDGYGTPYATSNTYPAGTSWSTIANSFVGYDLVILSDGGSSSANRGIPYDGSTYAFLAAYGVTSEGGGTYVLYSDQMVAVPVTLSELGSLPATSDISSYTFSSHSYYHVKDSAGNYLYADPNSGYSGTITYWSNGRSNNHLDLILRPSGEGFHVTLGNSAGSDLTASTTFNYPTIDLTVVDNILIVREVNSRLQASSGTGTVLYTVAVENQPYIWVGVDYSSQTLSFSYLRGWNGSGPWDSYKTYVGSSSFGGAYAAFPLGTSSYNFRFTPHQSAYNLEGTSVDVSGSFSLYVPCTVSALYTDPAMKDPIINTAVYYPEQYILQFSDVVYYGDSLTLQYTKNGSSVLNTYAVDYRTGLVNGLPLSTLGDDGVWTTTATDVPLSNMKISCVKMNDGYRVAVNGTVLNGLTALSSAVPITVTMNGTWDADVVIMKMESSTSTEYEWEPGAWSLDWNTFCIVGMATAFLSFLVCALTGRMSGVKMGALIAVSGICGLAYLAIYL